MGKRSRRPRRPAPPRELQVIHFRDPYGNERSVCNAEERATYSGDNVICTAVADYVTCGSCKKWIDTNLIHVCVRVYNNDRRISEECKGRSVMSDWLAYNRRNRPGVALFVDGQCQQAGYLTAERCEAISKELTVLKGGAL